MLVAVIPVLLTVAGGIFFGGGGGGDCCCGCGTPQPASCGCQCPAPAPCPACPQNYCPPPPVAYCPQVQPVYYPGCNTGSVGCPAAYPGGGGYAVSGAAKTVARDHSYPAPHLPVSGESYPAPRLPFSDAFPPDAGPNGGNNGLPYSPGYTGPPIGGENLGISLEPVAPSYESEEIPAGATSASNYASPLNKLRSPQNNCEQPKVKYVVLRIKKEPGSGIEDVMEEAEEVNHPPPVEATASPLKAHQIIDEINSKEEKRDGTEDDSQTRARGTSTFSDAKCNSKPLRNLIIENIIRDDALASKRAIHETSIKVFSDSSVDVICSGTGFTYLVSTTEHCEAQKDNVICFVYKRPLPR